MKKLINEYKKYEKIFKKLNPNIKVYFVLIPKSFIASDKYAHR
jgi:hypothetical protein|tara:strand:- start:2245 stop:2373 length:129 start_codon:yes stop_codon:yes gene_type:complete